MPDARLATSAGYTLTEVLVALVLLSIITAMLMPSFGFLARPLAHLKAFAEPYDEIRSVRQFLTAQFETLYPQPQRTNANLYRFEGYPDELMYVSAIPEPWSAGGRALISLFTERRDGDTLFQIAWRPLHSADENPKRDGDATRAVLFDDIDHVAFEYYDDGSRNSVAGWGSRWSDQRHLPALIKITVFFHDPNRAWAPLVITPRIDREASCTFNPTSQTCRERPS